MTLARRIWLTSGLLAVLIGGAFATLIVAASAQRDAAEREERSKDVTAASLEAEKTVLDVETAVGGITVTRSESYLPAYRGARGELPRRLATLERLAAGDPAQLARVRALEIRIMAYVEFVAALLPLVRETPEIARETLLLEEGRRYTSDIRARFAALRQVEEAATTAAAAEADRRTRVAVVVGAVALVASVLLIGLSGFLLVRAIGPPLRAVASGAGRIAAGDLSHRLDESGAGEVGTLTRAFNSMALRLEASRHDLEAQNEQLRRSEETKSELITIVSHELRTPLASVLGFTALLLKREFDAETRRHYLEIVDAQARRLAALLEDFLDVQRIEHEGLHLERERLDLARVIREQVELYRGQSPHHVVSASIGAEPLLVRGDPNRLAQVVGNLLSNAIKYSPDGGRVDVEARRDGPLVRVAVHDEGRGIPYEQQGRIFTKFYRGDAAATGISGTGLGLAVARQIVEAHEGRIGFDSRPGEGSTFWVEFPALETELSEFELKEVLG